MKLQTDPLLRIESKLARTRERIANEDTKADEVEASRTSGPANRKICQGMVAASREKNAELEAKLNNLQRATCIVRLGPGKAGPEEHRHDREKQMSNPSKALYSRIATMTSHVSPEFLRRMWTTLGGALKRGILGKSSHDYMKQFTGSDEYWDRAIAAQNGSVHKQPPQPGPDRFGSPGRPLEREFELVHGWTKRQLDDYLARNPAYRSTYEAKLQTQKQALKIVGSASVAPVRTAASAKSHL